jgi:4-hydroxybenzoate polyprenyltransferase
VLWTLCGVLAHLGFPYFAVLALVAAHFGWQLATLKPHDQADCLAKFKANDQVGWLMLLAILAAPLITAIR